MNIFLTCFYFIIVIIISISDNQFIRRDIPIQSLQAFEVEENLPKQRKEVSTNKKAGAKKITYKNVEWEDLVPKGWNPADELKDIDFDNLIDGDPRADEALMRIRILWDTAPAEPSLDGTNIKISGFAVPLEDKGDGIVEFLLVPYFGACIHTPPPPANQIIHVYATNAPDNFGIMYLYTISGSLKIDKSPTDMGFSTYVMQADSVEVYKE